MNITNVELCPFRKIQNCLKIRELSNNLFVEYQIFPVKYAYIAPSYLRDALFCTMHSHTKLNSSS